MYVYMHTCVYLCVYIYIYTYIAGFVFAYQNADFPRQFLAFTEPFGGFVDQLRSNDDNKLVAI